MAGGAAREVHPNQVSGCKRASDQRRALGCHNRDQFLVEHLDTDTWRTAETPQTQVDRNGQFDDGMRSASYPYPLTDFPTVWTRKIPYHE